jgi:hypothetical protein
VTDSSGTYAATAQRDAAIASVTVHADENIRGWGKQARDWIVTYSATHREFISEECVAAAYVAGIPKPHDARAWGGAFMSCSRDKFIHRNGYGISNNRHRSPTPLWRSCHPNFRELS